MTDEPSLAGLPFEQLIAAPLVSAAKASALLARTTSEFLQEVGNAPPLRFTFDRVREEPDEGRGGSRLVAEEVALSVPLLGAVAVPNLQIERMDVAARWR